MGLHIGCAGWSYRDWVGPVYPQRSSSDDWLPIYTRLFDTVEVDATFYALPRTGTVRGWIQRTQDAPGFTFSAKIPQEATHAALPMGNLAAARRVTTEFLDVVVRPLEEAARFEAVLVQLPPVFGVEARHAGADPLADLVALVEVLGPKQRRVAVEFRHRSWFKQPDEQLVPVAQDALADLGAAVAQIDGLGSTFTSSRTTDWSYHRLHGRRTTIPAAERGESWAPYNYLYSPQEIEEIAAAIQVHAAADTRTTVIFNNHYQGKAAQNAADLGAAIGRPRPRLPATPMGTPRLDEFL